MQPGRSCYDSRDELPDIACVLPPPFLAVQRELPGVFLPVARQFGLQYAILFKRFCEGFVLRVLEFGHG